MGNIGFELSSENVFECKNNDTGHRVFKGDMLGAKGFCELHEGYDYRMVTVYVINGEACIPVEIRKTTAEELDAERASELCRVLAKAGRYLTDAEIRIIATSG